MDGSDAAKTRGVDVPEGVAGVIGWGLPARRPKRSKKVEHVALNGRCTDLIETLRLINEPIAAGLIHFTYGLKSTTGTGKIPLEKLDTRVIPEGLSYGLQFMTGDDPHTFEPLKLSKPLFLRFSKQSDSDARAHRLRELLKLDSTKYSFGIVDTGGS